MEGNSSLEQTDLVINEGQTISEKSMREHLKPLTIRKRLYQNSIKRMSFLVKRNFPAYYHFTRNFTKEAGNYRTVAITIKDKSFTLVNPQLFQAK
jgi:hypothetical protein